MPINAIISNYYTALLLLELGLCFEFFNIAYAVLKSFKLVEVSFFTNIMSSWHFRKITSVCKVRILSWSLYMFFCSIHINTNEKKRMEYGCVSSTKTFISALTSIHSKFSSALMCSGKHNYVGGVKIRSLRFCWVIKKLRRNTDVCCYISE